MLFLAGILPGQLSTTRRKFWWRFLVAGRKRVSIVATNFSLDHPIIRAAMSGSISEFWALLTESKKALHARTAPSDEPLEWSEDYKKLVRLDHAIMACHLMTARVSFRSIPALRRQRLISLKIAIVDAIAPWILKRIAGSVFFWPRVLAKSITSSIRANQLELEAEQAIRRQMIRAMRDLRANILFKRTHRERKTKLVFTRNP